MPLYQVQLKQGKNIKTVDVEGKNVAAVLDFFDYISTMKVTLIREVVYRSPSAVVPADDFNYDTLFACFAKNSSGSSREFIFNNIKKSRNENEIFQKMKECLEVDNLNIDTIYASYFKE